MSILDRAASAVEQGMAAAPLRRLQLRAALQMGDPRGVRRVVLLPVSAPVRAGASGLFLATDEAARKPGLVDLMAKTPRHDATPAFLDHLIAHDATVPVNSPRSADPYIAAAAPMAGPGPLRRRVPAPHHRPKARLRPLVALDVPDQLNAILARFISVGVHRNEQENCENVKRARPRDRASQCTPRKARGGPGREPPVAGSWVFRFPPGTRYTANNRH